MSDKKVLHILDGTTGNVFVVHDFFDYSSFTQENILSDKVLPLLYDNKTVTITVAYSKV